MSNRENPSILAPSDLAQIIYSCQKENPSLGGQAEAVLAIHHYHGGKIMSVPAVILPEQRSTTVLFNRIGHKDVFSPGFNATIYPEHVHLVVDGMSNDQKAIARLTEACEQSHGHYTPEQYLLSQKPIEDNYKNLMRTLGKIVRPPVQKTP